MTALRSLFVFVALATVAGLPLAYAADWPQYLGPDRNGVSKETGLARAWPEAGPKELWKITVGEGYAGAAVRDGEVYVLDRTEDKTDTLRCLALQDGKELWSYSYVSEGKVGHNGSRTPPTVDEKFVYSVGLMGDFLCVDRKTHKPVWQTNLLKDLGGRPGNWGVAQSPLLYKDLVIVAAQAPDAFFVAYNRATGDIAWKSPGLGLPGYASPVLTTLAGVEQLVALGASNKEGTEKGTTAGISPKDGSILWQYDGWQCWIPIPHPATLPGDQLLITGGYKAGSAIIQIKKCAAGLEASEVKKFGPEAMGSQIHQPILHDGFVYMNNNSNEVSNGFCCFTLDGTLKWSTGGVEGQPNLDKGSFIIADGLIIALDAKSGILYLIEPSPEKYKELAKVQAVEGRELYGPLALSDGKLLVRSQDTMRCLDLKNP